MAMETQNRKLGQYEILELVEEGISGRLYKARSTETGRNVLLRQVSRVLSDLPQFRKKFFDQWAAHNTLIDHPNIANVVEFGRDGETYFIAIEGEDAVRLSQRLDRPADDPDEALEIIRQCAEALRAAHRVGVTHGTFAPDCVLIGRDKMNRTLVRVTFFDLAVKASESMVSVFGQLVGIPRYMAPEVIKGSLATARSDVFSLGVVAYELLTGRHPFPSDHPVGYLFSNCQAPLVPPSSGRERVSPELSAIVERMLSKDPATRYQSCQAVIDDLDRYQERVKTGHSSMVPAGADSAFAPHYRVPVEKQRTGLHTHHLTFLGVGSMIVAVLALVATIVIALHSGARGPVAALPPGVNETGKTTPPTAEPADKGAKTPALEPAAQARLLEEQARLAFQDAEDDWRRYKQTGAYQLALPRYEAILKDFAKTRFSREAAERIAQIKVEWAKVVEDKKEYLQAAQLMQEVLAVAPEGSGYRTIANGDAPQLFLKAADDLAAKGRYDEALACLRTIRKDFPGSVQAGMAPERTAEIMTNQGYDMIREQRYADALARFQQIIRDYPNSRFEKTAQDRIPGIYLEIARQKMKAGSLEDALKLLAQIEQGFKDTPTGVEARKLSAETVYNLFVQFQKTGEPDRAAGYFQSLLKDYPDSPWTQKAIRAKLGYAARKGEVMFDEQTAQGRLEAARRMWQERGFETAAHALEEIVRRTPEDSKTGAQALALLPEVQYDWAAWLYGTGKRDAARKRYADLAGLYPYSPWGRKAQAIQKAIANTPAGMDFVPDGPFLMGSSEAELKAVLAPLHKNIGEGDTFKILVSFYQMEDQMPQHTATTGAFYIDETEVTNAQYKKFCDETGHKPPPHWAEGQFPKGTESFPVVNVTADDAAAYAKWAGKRLPTETEWEKAARGVDGRYWPWGDAFDKAHAYHTYPESAGLAAVGSKPLGASPYGALDMIGNVWEWTSSPYEPYPGGKINDKFNDTFRVIRGGAWFTDQLNDVPRRCASRLPFPPDKSYQAIGFRCVKDAAVE